MAEFRNVWNIAVLLIIIGLNVKDGYALYTCTPAPNQCVCYDNVGCFSTDAPFNNTKGKLPRSPISVGVQAQLFTRRNPNETYPIDFINRTSLHGSKFDPALHTKFVIHGFANTNLTEWLYEMKDELLKKGDFNVFVISWGPGAAFPLYDDAVANSRMVARMVTLLVSNLVDEGLNPGKLHLIGHSLGAHLSGVAGAELQVKNIKIGRISGMDPAEPDFLKFGDDVRLTKDDASFVDVIHTDGQPFVIGIKGYGINIPSGHVDFFINGGQKQPDCAKMNPLGNLFSLLGSGTDALATAFSCSHSRSHQVFLESINSDCSFTAYPCESYEKFQAGDCFTCGVKGCTRMGYPANRYNVTGTFYLNTRDASPFCGHHYRVRVFARNSAETTGQFMVQLNGTWGTSEWLNVTKSGSDRLSTNAVLTRVVVAERTVGYVQSISIKYNASSRGGQHTLPMDRVEIEAGENGLQYLFCADTTLTSNKVEVIPSTSGKTCSA